MDKTQLYERAAPGFNLLHICICICVTHQVYQYFYRKKVEGYPSPIAAKDCKANDSQLIDSLMPPRPHQFRYDSLQDRTQVRLFCLYPGKYHDEITGCMYTVSIEELRCTHYEAISYVWGDPHNTVGICVESTGDSSIGILSITKNLEAALKMVRRRTLERVIWADGICINQTDVLERGHQVRLMRSIYEQANLVYVWLGAGSRECTDMHAQCAFNFLNSLKVKSRDEEIYGRIAETDDIIWRHLSHVLNRPWFRRIWILQEIGVARAATFYYGNASIDRNALYRACYILSTRIIDFPSITRLETPITWIRSLATHFHFNGSKSSLMISKFDLFDLARPCAATDPRDMIYALMGHPIFDIDDDEEFLPIDYSHSRERAYTEIALKLLHEPWNPLQLLSLVKHTGSKGVGRDSRLPSWVPAWDVKSPVQTLGERKPTFTASRSLRQTFTVSVDGLYTQGCPVDIIEWQSHTLRRTDFPEAREKTTMPPSLRSIIDVFVSLAIAPRSNHLRSCARTLIAAESYSDGQDKASSSPQEQLQDREIMFAFVQYVEALLSREVARGTGVSSVRTLQKVLARDCPNQQSGAGLKGSYGNVGSKGPMSFSLEARKWCTGRRFFTTAKGRFGIGPPVSQVGDPIYILSGAAVLFVFRRGSSNASSDFQDIQLCGECYVDGIMSGQGDRMLAEVETCLENLRII